MKARFISYLDLMCCGFGGAVLMFLITAAADPPRTPTNNLIMVRCHHELNSGNPRAEIAIEYQLPRTDQWIRPSPREPMQNNVIPAFAAVSTVNGGSEAVLVLRSPQPGEWRFRAYLVNYPQQAEQAGGNSTLPCQLRFEVKGNLVDASDFNSFELQTPGQSGPPVLVRFGN